MSNQTALSYAVEDHMREFFELLDGQPIQDLYATVMAQVEPPLIRLTLKACDGSASRAARMLGVNRATLRRKMVEHGIVVRRRVVL